MEEALHRRVVVTVPSAAHRGGRADRGELIDISPGGILRSVIGVMHESAYRSLPLGGHHQRSERQFGPHVIAHRPSHDLARCQIEHGGQIQPAFAGRDIADIGQSHAVLRCCFEALREQVRCNRQIMAAVGRRGLEPATGKRTDAVTAHQPLDTTAAAAAPFRA